MNDRWCNWEETVLRTRSRDFRSCTFPLDHALHHLPGGAGPAYEWIMLTLDSSPIDMALKGVVERTDSLGFDYPSYLDAAFDLHCDEAARKAALGEARRITESEW